MKRAVFLVIPWLFLSACAAWEPVEYADRDGAEVLFLADPQFHNVYGEHLKQTSLLSSRAAKVARRPPELNLLSRYAFADLIEQAASSGGNQVPVIVFLGDVANVACSGEFDDFQDALGATAGASRATLIAHGNHDSYLIGTSNRYNPGLEIPPSLNASELPVDVSIWHGDNQALGIGETSWAKMCFRPPFNDRAPGTPLNKVSWLAKYLETLKPLDMEVVSDSTIDGVRTRRFQSKNVSGVLAELDYELVGDFVSSGSDTKDLYDSFVVQAFNVGDAHRLVLIDTSVCHDAPPPPLGLLDNAGSRGCIGDGQFRVIDQLIRENRDRKLVFAGHFPLEDIFREDRHKLVERMEASGEWTYISAHTHHALQRCEHESGREYNVGSTTDWPMEANVFHFDNRTRAVRPWETFNLKKEADVVYTLEVAEGENPDTHLTALYEVCRHIPAARKLANMKAGEVGKEWESPEAGGDCLDDLQNVENEKERHAIWVKRATELKALVDEIDRKYRAPGGSQYRQAILAIAASASKSLHDRKDWHETVLGPFEGSCR